MRFNIVKGKPLGNTPADRCCNWRSGTCLGYSWTLPKGKTDGRAKPVVLDTKDKPCQADACNFWRKCGHA